jgi:hypothetical protein
MESEVTETEEYELNFADSYIEQIQSEMFQKERFQISDAELVNNDVKDGKINVTYKSEHEVDSLDFNREIAEFTGLYSGNIGIVRIPYVIDLTVNDKNGETYQRNLSDNLATDYLEGEINERQMNSRAMHDNLLTE